MSRKIMRSLLTAFGHLRKGPYVGSAAIVIKDGKILLNKERLGYTLPGGMTSYNEDPQDTVVREVKEETGIHVKVLKRIDVITDPKQSPTEHAIIFLYECEFVDGELKRSIEGTPEWVDVNSIPEDMQHGFSETLRKYFSSS